MTAPRTPRCFPSAALLFTLLVLPAWIVEEESSKRSFALLDPAIAPVVRSAEEQWHRGARADDRRLEDGGLLEDGPIGPALASPLGLAEENRRLGKASLEAGDHLGAIKLFKRQIRGEWHVAEALYDIARCHAARAEDELAFAHLDRAVAAGFTDLAALEHEAAFARLSRDPRFAELRLRTAQSARLARDGEHDGNDLRGWYRAYLGTHPGDARALHHFGCASAAAGDYDAALAAFRRQAELGFSSATAFYNVACCLAHKGQASAALDYLARAVAAGTPTPHVLATDPDLDPLRADPRFGRLLTGG